MEISVALKELMWWQKQTGNHNDMRSIRETMATGMEEGSVCVCVWREMEIISGRLEQVVFKSSFEDP